jgi:hypothetical protein
MSIRLGSLRGRSGVLRRVTRRSFLLDFGHLDLVSVVDHSLSLAPWGLCCDSSRLFELEPNDRASVLDDAILVGWARLSFSGAELFNPSMRVDAADRLVTDRGDAFISGICLDATCRSACDRIADADLSAVKILAGRGEGSTPLGDDLLVGLLAACWLRQLLGLPNNLVSLKAELSRIDETVTHPLSVRMIRDAISGDFPEALLRFVDALLGKSDCLQACRDLRSLGASSGDAMLFGLIRGIFPLPH